MPARQLEEELLNVEKGVRKMMETYNLNVENSAFLRALEEKLEQWKKENSFELE